MAENLQNQAIELAELMFKLLVKCEQKEYHLAELNGLTHAEFRCQRFLGKVDVLNNSEIARIMNLSASRLTRIIDGLVKKGYVAREINENDRRNMNIKLTTFGQAKNKKMYDEYLHIHKQILSELVEDDHRPMLDGMHKLYIALEKWTDNV
jgi:DNA-binding MarR family transcriptional regulator